MSHFPTRVNSAQRVVGGSTTRSWTYDAPHRVLALRHGCDNRAVAWPGDALSEVCVMDILHVFADTGVECEALSAYGDVARVGIKPEPNPFTEELIQADAQELSLNRTFDLGLFHPPCQRWTPSAQMQGTASDHENMIPVARELARENCDEWIIENVPQAPLYNPTVLNGGMFGLPLHYERAFETSYHVPQPPRQTQLGRPNDEFAEHHAKGGFKGSKALWKSAKGYSHDWPSRTLKRSGIPRAYINYLVRPIL